MREYRISSQDPDVEKSLDREDDINTYPENIVQRRNRDEGIELYIDRFPDTVDFYNENDKFTVSNKDRNKFNAFLDGLSSAQKMAYERVIEDEPFIYFVDFENHGGLISPLPLTLTYADGDTEELLIPAEIWRRNTEVVTKLIVRSKKVTSIALDTAHQTADANYDNNSYPPVLRISRLELYKSNRTRKNLVADMLVELKAEEESGAAKDTDKMVPLENSQRENGQRENGQTEKGKAPSSQTKPKTPQSSPSKTPTDEQETSLRKTLNRLLGRE